MTHQAVARILIVAEDGDLQSLYGAILESDNYSIHKSTYTSLEFTLDPVPDLIVLHYDFDFHKKILDLLENVHRIYPKTSRPLLLIVAPKDWSDLSLIVLVDEYRISPVAPDYFRKTVEDLLQKKRSNRACAM